jgi:preprotein translocase subunit SecA
MGLLKTLLDGNEREVKKLRSIVETRINPLEPQIEKLSNEQLAAKTVEFRERLAKGETLDDLLPEAFAVVREAAKRTLGQRHYDVQMIGGMVLHQGRMAEMATGEGKTLVATLPLYLNALEGKGAHLVTVNEYLAKRDAHWNGAIYHLLGLTVACLQAQSEQYPRGSSWKYAPGAVNDDPHFNDLELIERRDAYRCDILYGTNSEFGFDYLRDNMAFSVDELVQSELNYAIVDEADSILVDEARTPLIIAGEPQQSGDLYYRVDRVIARLEKEKHYTVDEKVKTAMPTDEGVTAIEQGLGLQNLADDVQMMHHVTAALKARFAYRLDVDYVVKDDKVIIVDENTGRLMWGRRYSDGLHQAIEAKEGVKIEEETQTVATITIQNYFRIYKKLGGMTGTAKTEENEFRKIYSMDVVVVPTNRPAQRIDHSDVIYRSEEAKFRGISQEILTAYARQQPTLVGTRSIETSERLSDRVAIGERLQTLALILVLREKLYNTKGLAKDKEQEYHELLNTKLDDLYVPKLAPVAKALGVDPDPLSPANLDALAKAIGLGQATTELEQALRDGIPHSVLNAKNHEREAEIIAQAGRKGAVTIATNMAGRGVDILLGGRPAPEERPDAAAADEVRRLGGLYIIGSERHESRRIDRQLRGRSGRQGDPGASRFFLSLEDELWRLFGDKTNRFLGGWTEDQPLEAKLLTMAIERAQKKVEEHHFGIRKHTLEYDDVMNVQRKTIYDQRRQVLEGADLRETVVGHMREMVEAAVQQHCSREVPDDEWDTRTLFDQLDLLFEAGQYVKADEIAGKSQEELVDLFTTIGEQRYEAKEQEFASDGVDIREIERQVTLQVINQKWIEHLNNMDYLREGIHLRGYAQQDPLVAYKKEAFEMFNALLETIQDEIVEMMYHVHLVKPEPRRRLFYPMPVDPLDPSIIGQPLVDDMASLRGSPPPTGGNGRGNGHDASDLSGSKKVGRNDPCPCGSGKKYKKCHQASGQPSNHAQ